MHKSLVQQCAAALLAATYLVVGATGDGLYYLLESPALAQVAGLEQSNDAGPSDSFFHDHGDGHWHHHAEHRSSLAPLPTESVRGQGSIDRNDAELQDRAKRASHHDHTTLLLAIAEAVEQSVLTSLPLFEASQAEAPIGLERHGRASTSDRATLGPRGPPLGGLA